MLCHYAKCHVLFIFMLSVVAPLKLRQYKYNLLTCLRVQNTSITQDFLILVNKKCKAFGIIFRFSGIKWAKSHEARNKEEDIYT